ncbi:MAG: NAD(P)-binding protein [Candidatus Hodarchaeales archaeon]|jgi:protoporphyrinogen oxidase
MSEQCDHFIAGGGLGGLLTAALLSQKGKKILLVERMPFFGGRFTSLRYKGFEIPTGAVHMIPHSRKGPLGQLLLQKLQLPLEIHDNEYFTKFYWDNKNPICHRTFWGILKAFPRMSQRWFILRKLLPGSRRSEKRSESFLDFLKTHTDDPQIFDFFNAITGFALSVDVSQLSTASMYQFFNRLYQRGRPGVPIGGCKAVITALINFIRQNKQNLLQKNCELLKIEMNGSLIESAICRNLKSNEEITVKAEDFIFNLGHPQVNQILSKSHLPYRLPSTPVAQGGGFAYRSKKSILKTSVIAQFPENKYVKGAVEPTTLSSDLAPPDEHLLVTHQVFTSKNYVRDTKRARDELLATFPQLKEEDELCIHTFRNGWPVNHAIQGKDNANFSDIMNLFFVGDGYKGNDGWMMTEGIANGVTQVVRRIQAENKEFSVLKNSL